MKPDPFPFPRGVLLIAHGARDPRWARPFEDAAARIRARHAGAQVQLAYLELMPPSIADAGAALAAAGCRAVDLLPLFLGAGGHVRKDLPRFAADLAAAHPGVAWRLHPAIGESDRVVAAMADAALDLLGTAPGTPGVE